MDKLLGVLRLLLGSGALVPVWIIWNDGQVEKEQWDLLMQNLGLTSLLGVSAGALSPDLLRRVFASLRALWSHYDESQIPNGCQADANNVMYRVKRAAARGAELSDALKEDWMDVLVSSYEKFKGEVDA